MSYHNAPLPSFLSRKEISTVEGLGCHFPASKINALRSLTKCVASEQATHSLHVGKLGLVMLPALLGKRKQEPGKSLLPNSLVRVVILKIMWNMFCKQK